jgi:hypothetical protein
MKITLVNSRFSKFDTPDTGKGHSGEFISQSKYDFDFYNGSKYGSYALFYVFGNLEVDFQGGGALSYRCQLTYRLEPLIGKPDIDPLVEKAHNDSAIDFERLFQDFEIVQFNSPLDELWVPESPEILREKINAAISKRFPL